MGYTLDVCYFKRISADAAIGDAGKAVDVVGYTILSGGTAGTLTFRNGTSASAPIAWVDTATTVSVEKSIALACPVRLDQGCFVDIDTNVTSATIFYRQALT